MKTAVVCVWCGVSPKDQHSLREGGICDYMKSHNLQAATHSNVLEALKKGLKVQND